MLLSGSREDSTVARVINAGTGRKNDGVHQTSVYNPSFLMIRNYFLFSLPLAALCIISFACSSPKQPDKPEKQARIEFRPDEAGKKVDVYIENNLFTSYFYLESLRKPVLYPIRTPAGNRVTRGFPFEQVAGERVDHPHHIGLWLNYGDVNGLDFWNNSDSVAAEDRHRYGSVVHREIRRMESGEEEALLEVAADWVAPDGAVLLTETTTYRFRGRGDQRSIDRRTTLTASAQEVLFRDNKEGVFALRVTRALEHPENSPAIFTDASGKATAVPVLDNEGVTGHYLNSEGVEGGDCWGKRARWTVLQGTLGDRKASIAILDHPDNPGYPTYWHARGYGLFSANPLGQQVFSNGTEQLNLKLSPGESITFNYRVIIEEGAEHLSSEEIEKEFSAFTGR
jgi:hypothetical protein